MSGLLIGQFVYIVLFYWLNPERRKSDDAGELYHSRIYIIYILVDILCRIYKIKYLETAIL